MEQSDIVVFHEAWDRGLLGVIQVFSDPLGRLEQWDGAALGYVTEFSMFGMGGLVTCLNAILK